MLPIEGDGCKPPYLTLAPEALPASPGGKVSFGRIRPFVCVIVH